jgi:ribonucleoside-diphosphate reductase alpha chain
LDDRNKNNSDIWNEINSNNGSVKSLDFLSDQEKEVFKTAREINQFVIIKQAADRQLYIDQGQSVNVFFTYPDPETKRNNPGLEEEVAQYIHNVHKNAWESGLKSLYYFRSEGAAKADVKIRKEEECQWCE